MADVSVLDVMLYGRPIGTLTHVGGDRTLFSFNDDYIEDEHRPILSLGFKDQFGGLITDFRPTQTRVPPFFSNLLPEGHMRDYLARRAGVKPVREFFLLRALGQDLPGALTIVPADGERWPQASDDEDQSLVEERRENALRFSLAGVQLKFSAMAEAAGGLTIPAKGVGGSWIVKLPSVQFEGVPENEYAMMTLARLMGMDVPRLHLINAEAIGNLPPEVDALKGKALVIERFDRLQGAGLVHMEDFAQIFGVYPDDKYGRGSARHLANVIATETTSETVREFLRRLTFNVLIGNSDMHLKNWSLIYPDRHTVALAPAYDFVSTIAYIPDETFALKFSRSRRYTDFTREELIHLADKARLPERLVLETVRETVELFHQHWAQEKANLPVSGAVAAAIDRHIGRLPRV